MSKLPIHTVQHVKSAFAKYQIIAIIFTAITLTAAFLAALTGFQLSKLQKVQTAAIKALPQPVDEQAQAEMNKKWEKQIKSLESQLAAEKAAAHVLKRKVQELEGQIAALKAVQREPASSESRKPVAPAKNQPPATGMKAPETNSTTPAAPAEQPHPSNEQNEQKVESPSDPAPTQSTDAPAQPLEEEPKPAENSTEGAQTKP